MKTQTIIQDYYGASYFLEANSDKELTVFVVDDNKVYLNLVKKLINRPNVTIHTFEIGEDCLKCMDLKPDLVILDYHLDGVNPGVMKGNLIAEIIEKESPDTEIIMVSSDRKFKLLADLHLSQSKSLLYKDNKTLEKVIDRTKVMYDKKIKNRNLKKSHKVMAIVTVVVAILVLGLYLLMRNYYA